MPPRISKKERARRRKISESLRKFHRSIKAIRGRYKVNAEVARNLRRESKETGKSIKSILEERAQSNLGGIDRPVGLRSVQSFLEIRAELEGFVDRGEPKLVNIVTPYHVDTQELNRNTLFDILRSWQNAGDEHFKFIDQNVGKPNKHYWRTRQFPETLHAVEDGDRDYTIVWPVPEGFLRRG